jgi:hypothetical protein
MYIMYYTYYNPILFLINLGYYNDKVNNKYSHIY